jgi:hypothetical protein
MKHRVRMFTIKTGRRKLLHVELDAGGSWGWDLRHSLGRRQCRVRWHSQAMTAASGERFGAFEFKTWKTPGGE